MDPDATWYEGRPRPQPHCVRWGPSSPLKRPLLLRNRAQSKCPATSRYQTAVSKVTWGGYCPDMALYKHCIYSLFVLSCVTDCFTVFCQCKDAVCLQGGVLPVLVATCHSTQLNSTQLNSTSCNGRRCEHLFFRISIGAFFKSYQNLTGRVW